MLFVNYPVSVTNRFTGKLKCYGNGREARTLDNDGKRQGIECKGDNCQYRKDRKCKKVGRLYFIIDKLEDEGIWCYPMGSEKGIENVKRRIERANRLGQDLTKDWYELYLKAEDAIIGKNYIPDIKKLEAVENTNISNGEQNNNSPKTNKTNKNVTYLKIVEFKKAVYEDKEVSKIIYYVEYILIVTIIMSSFSEILDSVKNSITDLIGFSQSLIPLLITLMLYTGSITTSSVLEPILLFLIQFIANLIQNLILPVVSIIVVLIVISKISERIQITKLAKFMNTSIVWFLGIVLTLFVGVMSLEGTLTASVDGITAKTTKAAVSNLIPVVGKILGDSVDTVLGCGVVLKNAVGVVGVIVIIGICLLPIIKLATFSIMYSILSCVIEPLADEKIVKLIEEMSGIFKLLLAILCSVSVLLIIGVTLVIKISNSGMMYR